MKRERWVHPLGMCDSANVGNGTRIWAFAHVMKDAVVGEDCNIGEHVFVESGAVVGSRCTIKNGVMIWEGITLEDDVFVGPGVVFTNDRFPRSPRLDVVAERYHGKGWVSRTVVRRGASIGAGAVILPGIEIGEFATVAAGAVVTKPVPAHRLAVGSPAKIKAWMCLCGGVLNAGRKCPLCNRSYKLVRGKLVETQAGKKNC